jgi:hypothetical protein
VFIKSVIWESQIKESVRQAGWNRWMDTSGEQHALV